MTWLTHTFFAGTTAHILGLNPAIAVIGSTAPDWTEDLFGINEHRGITHYLVLWFLALMLTFLLFLSHAPYSMELLSFTYGSMTHLFLDALTKTGIPLYGKQRIRIGGLITTGRLSEWLFLALLILFLTPLIKLDAKLGHSRYKELHKQGIIDRKEYNERKFKLWE
ncbi:MAG: metal-dependent hydrolase [Aquificae bacterium]|nr:metal-dependent hydrolase [Aquificota bacterium]